MALETAGLEWINKGLPGFIDGLGRADSAMGGVSKEMDGISTQSGRTGSAFSMLGSVVTGISTAMATAAISAVTQITKGLVNLGKESFVLAGDFQSQMTRLSIAASGAGVGFEDLHEAALLVGGDTRLLGVSATGAADAMTGLFKAGLKTTDIFGDLNAYMNEGAQLGGVLRASIDLAAATELDMVAASELASTTMTQFGISAEDVTGAMDYFVRAADASVADISGIRDALVNCGPVMKGYGFTAEDTADALALLSNAGIRGSEAGTALRSMFTAITKPTAKTTAALEAHGIVLTDNAGNYLDLVDMIAQFEAATNSMTEAQASNFAQTVASSYGKTALLALINQGVEDYARYSDAVGAATGIAAQAEAQSKTYAAQLEAFHGVMETLQLRIGEAFLPTMTELLVVFSDLVSRYGPLLASVFEAVGDVIQNVVGTISEAYAAFQEGGFEGLAESLRLDPSIADTLNSVVDGIRRIGEAIFGLPPGEDFDAKFKLESASETVSIIERIITKVQQFLDTIFGTQRNMDDRFRLSPEAGEATETVIDKILAAIEAVKVWFDANGPVIQAGIETLGVILGDVFGAVKEVIVSDVWPALQEAFANIGEIFQELGWEGGSLKDTIVTVVTIIGVVIGTLAAVVSGVAQGIAGAVKAITEVWQSLVESFSGVFESISEMAEGAKEFWKGLFTLDTEKIGKGVEKAFKGLLKFVESFGKALVTLLTGPLKVILKAIGGFVKGIVKFFKALKDKLIGHSIVVDMMKKIKDVIEDVLEKIAKFIERILDAILKVWTTIFHDIKDVMEKVLGGIKDVTEKVLGRVADFIEKTLEIILKVWTVIFHDLEGVTKKVFEAIEKIVSTVMDSIRRIVDTVTAAIGTTWSKFTALLESVWDKTWNAIKTILDTVLSAIKTAFNTAISAIKTAWENFKTSLETVWATLWENLKTGVETGWENIKTAISTGLTDLLQFFTDKMLEFKTRGTQIVDNIKSGITEAWHKITDAITSGLTGETGSIWSKIGAAFESIKTKAKEIVTAIKEGITTTWSNITDAISAKLGELKDKITEVANWEKLTAAGKAIISGIKAGLKAVWSSITTALSEKIADPLVGIGTAIAGAWSSIVAAGGKIVSGLWAGIQAHWAAFIQKLWDAITNINWPWPEVGVKAVPPEEEEEEPGKVKGSRSGAPASPAAAVQRAAWAGMASVAAALVSLPLGAAQAGSQVNRSLNIEINPTYEEVASPASIYDDVVAALAAAMI